MGFKVQEQIEHMTQVWTEQSGNDLLKVKINRMKISPLRLRLNNAETSNDTNKQAQILIQNMAKNKLG